MFIVQEIQTNGTTSALTPALTYTDRDQAEAAYHTTCAAAAVSSVTVHTVLMYDEHGNVIRREFYEHMSESE